MPQIIAFTSPKGGCGSTFVCASLWYIFTELGKKVMALDMCFEKCTLDFALGFQDEYVYTFADALGGTCDVNDAFAGTCDSAFARWDYESGNVDYTELKEILSNTGFDYILIDMSSFLENTVEGVLSIADELVLVSDCTVVSAKLCDMFLNRFDFPNARLVINKIVPRYIKNGVHLTVDELLDMVGTELLGLVPHDECVEIILKDGTLQGLKTDVFSGVFKNIAMRLTGERIPACDITDKKTRNSRVKGRK